MTHEAIPFLSALFAPDDQVLYRPIEVWKDRGRSHSKVIYHAVTYRQPGMKNDRGQWCHAAGSVGATLAHLERVADSKKANLFYGTCPRFGGGGQYDLAWQIRTVRFLWSDIDDTTPEEALARCEAAKLPRPTAVVASGHGAHLYWLLTEPYHIDDCADPLPVLTEFIENGDGKKMPHKCVVGPDGERHELQQAMWVLDGCRLSAKAHHIQDVLAGIAEAIGGDHAHDLARLLRVPGTLNRKNERNGDDPTRCQLVELDTARRYDIADFERFAVDSPTVKRREAIAKVPLPTPRRLTPARKDKLSQLAWECDTAPVGQRSERDFALICWAIEHGHSQVDTWSVVGTVGKFAERGEEYFNRTWEKAEQHTRENIFDKLTAKAGGKKKRGEIAAPQDPSDGAEDADRPRIIFDSEVMDVADLLDEITTTLIDHGDCYIRADQPVVIYDDMIEAIDSPAHLAAVLGYRTEFAIVERGGPQNCPLPTRYGSMWLRSRSVVERAPRISLFSRNPVFSKDDRLIPPGYDGETGIYYAGPAIEPHSGTARLDELLQDFCFRDPADRTNYLGILLTVLLMPRFIGSKPGVIFNGNQPALGKTLLAQIIAILRDGAPVETATYNKNDEEFEKRIGSLVRNGRTTIIIDNAKAKQIDSPCLERCLTDQILSFRLLGSSSSIAVENSHIVAITANVTGAARDIITRTVPISLEFEGNPVIRRFTIQDPEGFAVDHRLTLLAELAGMIERWKEAGRPHAPARSRFDKRGWSTQVGGILQVAAEPDFLANLDQAAKEFDPVGADFAELVEVMANDPKGWWEPAALVSLAEIKELFSVEFRSGSARSKAIRMGKIAGRFVDERFDLCDSRSAILRKRFTQGHPGYAVEIEENENG